MSDPLRPSQPGFQPRLNLGFKPNLKPCQNLRQFAAEGTAGGRKEKPGKKNGPEIQTEFYLALADAYRCITS